MTTTCTKCRHSTPYKGHLMKCLLVSRGMEHRSMMYQAPNRKRPLALVDMFGCCKRHQPRGEQGKLI